MADYYLNKTAAHIDELLEKVESLENYDDTEVRGLINNKQDKETGKGLSTNDFTDSYKTAVEGAAPQSTTYTKAEVDASQEEQDARITTNANNISDLKAVVGLEHYGMKWDKNNSDPQARCIYLYDCTGFTPMQCQADGTVSRGSWSNAFFVKNNYPAMVKPDGSIDYKLDPNDHSKDLDGNNSHITDHATDNAMAVFDCKIWIKWYEDTDYQYIEIANFKLDEDFHDYPYHREDGFVNDKLFYPMYEGTIVDGKLRSLSGSKAQSNTTAAEELAYAQSNGDNWSIGDWSHHLWYTLLCMLVGKTTCPEISLGEGNTNGGNDATGFVTNGECNSRGQFWGKPRSATDAENNQPVKAFYVENPYGNRWKRTLGMYNVLGTYYIKSSPPYTVDDSYDSYESCGSNPSGNGYVKDLKLTSMGFVPSTVGGSASTYTGTYYYENDGRIDLPIVGGFCNDGANCGLWFFGLHVRSSIRDMAIGASLYLI